MDKRLFEQRIKEQIEGFAPSECPQIWSKIEGALDAEQKRRKMIPLWVISVAASLILIVTAGLLTYNFDRKDAQIASLLIQSDTVRQLVEQRVGREVVSGQTTSLSVPVGRTSGASKTLCESSIDRLSDQIVVAQLLDDLIDSTRANVVSFENLAQQDVATSIQSSSTSTTTTTTTITTKSQVQSTNQLVIPGAKTKIKTRPLSMSLASNNSVVNFSQNSNSTSPLFRSSDNRLLEWMQLANGTTPPRRELLHYQPIRISVTARKRLLDHLSLETGLAYSYLYSQAKTQIGVERKESQELHYLGLPVSAIVDIVDGRRWSFYVKVGGQIDLNVLSKWKEKWFENGREFAHSTGTVLESKPQFSTHLALGVGYKFTKKVQLSLEPGANYYFDNESEVENIYKERPLSGSVNVALSYLF